MNLRQTAPTLLQQSTVFNQACQPGSRSVMMTSQAPNLQISNSWGNPNPALSVDTVTINPSGSMSNPPNSSRQQQPNRSGYLHRLEHNSCEGNTLPQLSMRDLQCLDTVSQSPVMSQSELLFHQQRKDIAQETQAQCQMGNQNQGVPTVWPSFSTLNTVQNNFNESVLGGGGGSQGIGSFPFLEGMEGEDFLKGLVGGISQTGFQLKQEPQITIGQDSSTSLMQSPRESQGNTYTNLLPRPISNGTNMDLRRQEGSGMPQHLTNLQNSFANNSMPSEGHYSNLADWVKDSQQSN